jgi:hypothetical protein
MLAMKFCAGKSTACAPHAILHDQHSSSDFYDGRRKVPQIMLAVLGVTPVTGEFSQ